MDRRTNAINEAKSFVSECELGGLKFEKVFLFGSVASDQMHEYSDIDLILVSNQFTKNPFEDLKLFSKININYPSIETHTYNTNDYLNGNSFIEHIKPTAIELK